MKRKFALVASVGLVVLSGCASIGSKAVSDQTLATKAAFALNTTADKVVISNRRVEGLYTLHFIATTRNKDFQCNVMVHYVGTSDANCAGMDGSTEGIRRNDWE